MCATIIAIANHKGGVAKTQTAVELGHFLSSTGKKVLVADIDPQANTSNLLLAGNDPSGRTIEDILTSGDYVIHPKDVRTRVFGSGVAVDYVCSSILATRIEGRAKCIPVGVTKKPR